MEAGDINRGSDDRIRLARARLDDLNTGHQSLAPKTAEALRVLALNAFEFRIEPGSEFGGALHQLLALQNLEIGDSGSSGQRRRGMRRGHRPRRV